MTLLLFAAPKLAQYETPSRGEVCGTQYEVLYDMS